MGPIPAIALEFKTKVDVRAPLVARAPCIAAKLSRKNEPVFHRGEVQKRQFARQAAIGYYVSERLTEKVSKQAKRISQDSRGQKLQPMALAFIRRLSSAQPRSAPADAGERFGRATSLICLSSSKANARRGKPRSGSCVRYRPRCRAAPS